MTRLRVNPNNLARITLPRSGKTVSLASSPTPSTPVDISNFNLNSMAMSHMSADIATEIGFGDLVKSSTSTNVVYLLAEYLATSYIVGPCTTVDTNQTLLIGQGLGMGFRIAVQVMNASASLEANLASVASAAELKGTSAKAMCLIHGLNPAIQAGALAVLPTSTTFNSDYLQGMAEVAQYISAAVLQAAIAGEALYAQPVYVDEDLVDLPYGAFLTPGSYANTPALPPDPTIGFALKELQKGRGYDLAISDLATNLHNATYPNIEQVNPLRAAAIYSLFLGQYDASIASGNNKVATSIYNLGS